MRIIVIAFLASVGLASAANTDPLGKLSEKYESSGRGPATVSTGKGDPGGVSCGSYQLASKYYPNEFKGLQGQRGVHQEVTPIAEATGALRQLLYA